MLQSMMWLQWCINYCQRNSYWYNPIDDAHDKKLALKNNNNINYSIKDSKSFDYKTRITGKL